MILFFLTYHSRLEMAFEIQTEILLRHLMKGDFVCIVIDKNNAVFQSQSWYPNNKAEKYRFSIMIDKLLSLISKYQNNYIILNYKFKEEINTLKNIGFFKSIEDVKSLKYQDYNIGYGVSSYLISYHRNHGFDIKKNREKLIREIKVGEILVDTIMEYDKKYKPTYIYFFNGRLSTSAPLVDYCKKNKIDYRVFEFTNRKDKFHLLDNAIPHNLSYRHEELMSLWESSILSEKEKETIGASFFENQRNGVELLEESFLKLQDKTFNIELLDSKRIITFFNSSIDEFASVPDWEKFVYVFNDEIEAINEICERYKNDSNMHFILRIHPNLKFLKNKQIIALESLKSIKNLTVFEPESPVFSYQLIDKSNCIIVFGSTIGVEACYFNRPSISLAKSFYENLDVAYFPKNKEQLYELIDNKNLKPRPKKNCYKYGYWMLNYGESFKLKKAGVYNSSDLCLSMRENRFYQFYKIFNIYFLVSVMKSLRPSLIAKSSYRLHLINKFKKLWH